MRAESPLQLVQTAFLYPGTVTIYGNLALSIRLSIYDVIGRVAVIPHHLPYDVIESLTDKANGNHVYP